MKVRITDILSHEATVECNHDQIAETIGPWFDGGPGGIAQTVQRLQNSWTPNSSPSDQGALAAFLGVRVEALA